MSKARKHVLAVLKMVTAEDKMVDWVDFKKAYPKLERNPAIKELFGGRRKIPLSEVKEKLPAILKRIKKGDSEFEHFDDIKFTLESWSGGQRSFGVNDVVIVANMGPQMVEELKEKAPELLRYMESNSFTGHPGGKHGIGWTRVAPLKGQAIIEEVQSDPLDRLWSAKVDENVKNLAIDYFVNKAKWHERLLKQTIAACKQLAAKDAKDGEGEVFWIGPELVKRDHSVRSERKINTYYKTLPKKMGFYGPALYSLSNKMVALDPEGRFDLYSNKKVAKDAQKVKIEMVQLKPAELEHFAAYFALLGAGGMRESEVKLKTALDTYKKKVEKNPSIESEFEHLKKTLKKDGVEKAKYDRLVK